MKVNSQLERAQVENVTALPSAGTTGRVVFNTVDGKFYIDDGTNYRAFLRNDGKAVFGNSGTAANNIRFHRGANGVLQLVTGADVTAEGTLSTAISQLASRNENYIASGIPTFGNAGRLAFITDTGFLNVDTGSAWKVLVDTSSTQTITGKSLTDPTMTASAVYAQIATPGAPSAGFTKLYSKSDGKYYYMSSDGIEHAIGSGSGSGGKNYAPNDGNFESGTSGYSLFNTTLTSLVPTGSITAGAASFTTFNTTTTGKLGELASLQIAASSAFAAGAGVITDVMDVDLQDRNGKVLAFKMKYTVTAGASNLNFSGTSANTFQPYIYDVTNSAWIQPVGVYSAITGTGVGEISGSFQTSATGTQYRLALICINASAGAATLLLDAWNIGPSSTALSKGTIAARAYGASLTLTGSDQVMIYPNVDFDTSGSYNKATGIFTCPVSGLYRLTGYLLGPSTARTTNLGTQLVAYKNGSLHSTMGSSLSQGSTTIRTTPSGSALINCVAGDQLAIRCTDSAGGAIDQFSSAVNWGSFELIQSADGQGSEGQAIVLEVGMSALTAHGANTSIKYDAILKDSAAGWSAATGLYTAPVSGTYRVSVQGCANGAWSCSVKVAGVYKSILMGTAVNVNSSGTTTVTVNAGDTIGVYTDSAVSFYATGGNGYSNFLCIERISGTAANQSANPPSITAAYQWDAWSPVNNSGTQTNAPSTGNSTSQGITIVNSSGTVTMTFPVSGRYLVGVNLACGNSQAYSFSRIIASLGGTAQRYRGNNSVTTVGQNVDDTDHGIGVTFLVTAVAGQTVTVLPKFETVGATAASNYVAYADVSAVRVGNI